MSGGLPHLSLCCAQRRMLPQVLRIPAPFRVRPRRQGRGFQSRPDHAEERDPKVTPGPGAPRQDRKALFPARGCRASRARGDEAAAEAWAESGEFAQTVPVFQVAGKVIGVIYELSSERIALEPPSLNARVPETAGPSTAIQKTLPRKHWLLGTATVFHPDSGRLS